MTLREKIRSGRLFFDGAMGTMLQAAGLPAGALPERWNTAHPEEVAAVHAAYLQRGVDVVTTNTFGANGLKFTDDELSAIVPAAMRIAKESISACGREGEAYVALDIGPSGKLLKPMGDLPFEDAYALFAKTCRLGAQAGADLVLIETMSDTMEIKAAVLAARENTSLPIGVTMVFDENGKLLCGCDVAAAVALLEGLGVDLIGINCGLGPAQCLGLTGAFYDRLSTPLLISPNAGLPHVDEEGNTRYDVDPDIFAEQMSAIAAAGARHLGGCCGTTPEHIGAMIERCAGIEPLPLIRRHRTVVSSYSRCVEFGSAPVIIGERINPTGKKLLKQALREKDIDYILREGLQQQEAGADVLDVNVGLPGIDEKEMMDRAVTELQGVLELPLQIDSSDPAVLEMAMRHYNGKPLVNSVSGKEGSLRAVLPLVKKYGGVVVALTLDEDGIPETAEGRLAVAEKIVRRAEEYGVSRDDILVDALTLTVSSDPGAAHVTLDSLSLIRKKLGVHTVLGVSNVSFGLPERDALNAAFLAKALDRGLDGAIVNPLSEPIMRTIFASNALLGRDVNFSAYLQKYGGEGEKRLSAAAPAQYSLFDAIVAGIKETAAHACEAALSTRAPMDVIESELIPALDLVGKEYEAGKLFLPRLLMSAEAARTAFQVLRKKIAASGDGGQSGGDKIILATVKGDIHDIGKNIVKALLENYGFHVIDLGKDVPIETVVAAAKEQQVRLVGLSALMTTTVVNMEKTIETLHREYPSCRIMVGGAVLTADYARQIGADFYGWDAMAAVNYARELFG